MHTYITNAMFGENTTNTLFYGENNTASFHGENNSRMSMDGQNRSGLLSGSEVTVSTLLPRTTYSSLLELYVTLIVQTAMLLWVFAAHSLIICTIWRCPVLHSPNNYITAAYSGLDITMQLITLPLFLGTMPTDTPVPAIACQLGAMTRVATFFAMVYVIAVMVYERYRFFVHPLTHSTLFSPRRTAIITGLAVGVPCVYALITEITVGRVYHESIIICQLPGTRYLKHVQLGGFFLPSLLISTYCTIRICSWRLAMASRVAPAEMERDAAPATQTSDASKIGVTLKAIVLVSGAFWGTYIPGFVLRTALFSSGYTWDGMDSRRQYGAAMAIRLSQIMLMDFSPTLNPVIYYYTNKQMRAMIRKTLGRPIAGDSMVYTTNAST